MKALTKRQEIALEWTQAITKIERGDMDPRAYLGKYLNKAKELVRTEQVLYYKKPIYDYDRTQVPEYFQNQNMVFSTPFGYTSDYFQAAQWWETYEKVRDSEFEYRVRYLI